MDFFSFKFKYNFTGLCFLFFRVLWYGAWIFFAHTLYCGLVYFIYLSVPYIDLNQTECVYIKQCEKFIFFRSFVHSFWLMFCWGGGFEHPIIIKASKCYDTKKKGRRIDNIVTANMCWVRQWRMAYVFRCYVHTFGSGASVIYFFPLFSFYGL